MNLNVRYLAFLVLFLITEGKFFCQKILYPELNPVNRRFDNFQIENGRADPTTVSLLQDRKGFIWSDKTTGLYRFDRESEIFACFKVDSVIEDPTNFNSFS